MKDIIILWFSKRKYKIKQLLYSLLHLIPLQLQLFLSVQVAGCQLVLPRSQFKTSMKANGGAVNAYKIDSYVAFTPTIKTQIVGFLKSNNMERSLLR
jgi:uncharacterized membrane protein